MTKHKWITQYNKLAKILAEIWVIKLNSFINQCIYNNQISAEKITKIERIFNQHWCIALTFAINSISWKIAVLHCNLYFNVFHTNISSKYICTYISILKKLVPFLEMPTQDRPWRFLGLKLFLIESLCPSLQNNDAISVTKTYCTMSDVQIYLFLASSIARNWTRGTIIEFDSL